MTEREIERALDQFEGLVLTTARQIMEHGVELELEDVQQLLRVKVWRIILRYDQTRSALPLRRFVFGCLFNLRKDIEKRPRRYNASLDELRERSGLPQEDVPASDWFDERFLSVDAEQVYAEVEDEEVTLPSTLTSTERRIVALKLRGRMLLEIDRELGLSRAQRERAMRSIREKLADWAPSATPPRTVPMQPLPGAEPRQAPARAALAA